MGGPVSIRTVVTSPCSSVPSPLVLRWIQTRSCESRSLHRRANFVIPLPERESVLFACSPSKALSFPPAETVPGRYVQMVCVLHPGDLLRLQSCLNNWYHAIRYPRDRHRSQRSSLPNNAFRAPVLPANRFAPVIPGVSVVSASRNTPFIPSIVHPCWFPPQSVGSTRGRIQFTSLLRIAHIPRPSPHSIPATPFSTEANFDFAAFGYALTFANVPVSASFSQKIFNPKPMAPPPNRRNIVTNLPGCSNLCLGTTQKRPGHKLALRREGRGGGERGRLIF